MLQRGLCLSSRHTNAVSPTQTLLGQTVQICKCICFYASQRTRLAVINFISGQSLCAYFENSVPGSCFLSGWYQFSILVSCFLPKSL